MADITLTFSIPDNKLAEVMTALRWHFGKKDDGSDYTNAELRAKLRDSMVSSVRDIYTRYKRDERDKQPIDTDAGIN